MRAVLAFVEGYESIVISEIIKLATDIYNKKTSQYHEILLVKNYHETVHDNLLDFISRKLNTTCNTIVESVKNVVKILKKQYANLYAFRINYNVVKWLSGFYEKEVFSCVYFKNNGIIEFCSKQINQPLQFKSRYIVLDATGASFVVDKICYRSIPVVNIDIEWTCNSLFLEKTIKKSTDVEEGEIIEINY